MLKKFAFTNAVLFLTTTGTLLADSFSQTYTGSLATTTTVLQEDFTLSTVSNLNVFTSSYSAGGFQPSLTLYTGAGAYVASQGVSYPGAVIDPLTGLALDAQLTRGSLLPGSYILVLTNWLEQQPPTATNLLDGFVNYGGASFTDAGGFFRSGNYVLSSAATAAAPAAVPEPVSFLLLPLGLSGICCFRRKQKSVS